MRLRWSQRFTFYIHQCCGKHHDLVTFLITKKKRVYTFWDGLQKHFMILLWESHHMKLWKTIYIILNFEVFFFFLQKTSFFKIKLNKWVAITRHGSNNKSSQFLFEKIKLKLSSVLKPDNNSVFSGVFIKV